MAAIEYRTLADYASTYTLYADCLGCRRSVVLDPARTAAVTGWQVTLPALKAALTCSAWRSTLATKTGCAIMRLSNLHADSSVKV